MIDGVNLEGDGQDGYATEDELVPDGEEMDQPQDVDESKAMQIRNREQFVKDITQRFGESAAGFGIEVVEDYFRQRMQGAVPNLQHLQQELQSIIEDPNERKDFFEQTIAQLITEPVTKRGRPSNLI